MITRMLADIGNQRSGLTYCNVTDTCCIYETTTSAQLTCNTFYLSYDVASGSEITPCNKICKPLMVYRFSENVNMTAITTLRT